MSRACEGIVESTITPGHSLNLTMVAEFVETIEQLEKLNAKICDIVQGYYFS